MKWCLMVEMVQVVSKWSSGGPMWPKCLEGSPVRGAALVRLTIYVCSLYKGGD